MLGQLSCIFKYCDIFNNRDIIIHDNRLNKFGYRPTLLGSENHVREHAVFFRSLVDEISKVIQVKSNINKENIPRFP